MGINVLSLFDGMSCGRIALERAGIKVDNYFASEVDKHAIKVTQHNYPDTVQLGDVTKISYKDGVLTSENGEWFIGKVNVLLGGSPCQNLSSLSALHGDSGLAGDKSSLFYHYLRLKRECNPDFFLLENVVMKDRFKDAISNLLGVKPILINSATLSAHTRKRLYWSNIEGIEQPEGLNITLSSILESGYTEKEKAYCLTATYANACVQNYFIKSERQHKFMYPVEKIGNTFKINNEVEITIIPSKGANENRANLNLLKKYTSKLTPVECERLQTVSDGYTKIVSDRERYRMLGNGWTVDVIAHIFKPLANQLNIQKAS